MTDYTLSPAQIHRYDQVHAHRGRRLDSIINATRDSLSICHHETVIIELAHYLATDTHPAETAELLACAIERLTPTSDTPASHPTPTPGHP